jgi:hypothetical protein
VTNESRIFKWMDWYKYLQYDSNKYLNKKNTSIFSCRGTYIGNLKEFTVDVFGPNKT